MGQCHVLANISDDFGDGTQIGVHDWEILNKGTTQPIITEMTMPRLVPATPAGENAATVCATSIYCGESLTSGIVRSVDTDADLSSLTREQTATTNASQIVYSTAPEVLAYLSRGIESRTPVMHRLLRSTRRLSSRIASQKFHQCQLLKVPSGPLRGLLLNGSITCSK